MIGKSPKDENRNREWASCCVGDIQLRGSTRRWNFDTLHQYLRMNWEAGVQGNGEDGGVERRRNDWPVPGSWKKIMLIP